MKKYTDMSIDVCTCICTYIIKNCQCKIQSMYIYKYMNYSYVKYRLKILRRW